MSDVPGPLVLYVEDEFLIQELGIAAFDEGGFTVSVHRSGTEAIKALESEGENVKALVTDIDLGRAPNGWEVAKRARELFPKLPIVYVSGGSAHEWSANGVPGSILVAKPYAVAQLIVAVSTAMLGPAGSAAVEPA
jgi:CheY-like chemotaxis protein